jgi:hypothetical protein
MLGYSLGGFVAWTKYDPTLVVKLENEIITPTDVEKISKSSFRI